MPAAPPTAPRLPGAHVAGPVELWTHPETGMLHEVQRCLSCDLVLRVGSLASTGPDATLRLRDPPPVGTPITLASVSCPARPR